MHIPRLAADERFIHFNFRAGTTQFHKRLILKRKSKALQHKPCRLLSYSNRAVNLHAGHAVLAINQHPKCRHPLIQSNRRVLKDRIHLERELLVAATAKPKLPSLNKVVFARVAARANDLAIRPAKLHGIVKGAVGIGEINDGFL
jgi:hypothetical protein